MKNSICTTFGPGPFDFDFEMEVALAPLESYFTAIVELSTDLRSREHAVATAASGLVEHLKKSLLKMESECISKGAGRFVFNAEVTTALSPMKHYISALVYNGARHASPLENAISETAPALIEHLEGRLWGMEEKFIEMIEDEMQDYKKPPLGPHQALSA